MVQPMAQPQLQQQQSWPNPFASSAPMATMNQTPAAHAFPTPVAATKAPAPQSKAANTWADSMSKVNIDLGGLGLSRPQMKQSVSLNQMQQKQLQQPTTPMGFNAFATQPMTSPSGAASSAFPSGAPSHPTGGQQPSNFDLLM
uniref:Uncharacterized protein n=1 Tax=Plectus sambesii TaxID=2011161 RepID=A0A914XGI9_9BILA